MFWRVGRRFQGRSLLPNNLQWHSKAHSPNRVFRGNRFARAGVLFFAYRYVKYLLLFRLCVRLFDKLLFVNR